MFSKRQRQMLRVSMRRIERFFEAFVKTGKINIKCWRTREDASQIGCDTPCTCCLSSEDEKHFIDLNIYINNMYNIFKEEQKRFCVSKIVRILFYNSGKSHPSWWDRTNYDQCPPCYYQLWSMPLPSSPKIRFPSHLQLYSAVLAVTEMTARQKNRICDFCVTILAPRQVLASGKL